MRILKYIFLLLLLSLVALTIFIATQKGDFTVERSHIIKAPKNTVYQFVNDLRNWEDFATWISKDAASNLAFSEKSIGNGATMNWDNQTSSGSIATLSTQENDSISQKMDFDAIVIGGGFGGLGGFGVPPVYGGGLAATPYC